MSSNRIYPPQESYADSGSLTSALIEVREGKAAVIRVDWPDDCILDVVLQVRQQPEKCEEIWMDSFLGCCPSRMMPPVNTYVISIPGVYRFLVNLCEDCESVPEDFLIFSEEVDLTTPLLKSFEGTSMYNSCQPTTKISSPDSTIIVQESPTDDFKVDVNIPVVADKLMDNSMFVTSIEALIPEDCCEEMRDKHNTQQELIEACCAEMREKHDTQQESIDECCEDMQNKHDAQQDLIDAMIASNSYPNGMSQGVIR